MKKTQYIKLFSHNDLDGFGAPSLFYTLKNEIFPTVEFDLTTCSAGNLDRELAYWFRQPEASRFTDVYIMDMTPDSDYSFQLLEQKFANHWLIFDHHESEADLRQKYRANCPGPRDESVNPSATSLVWDWLTEQPHYNKLSASRQTELAYLVELIRAYDTWDWQNDPLLPEEEKKDADELNQLFWFYPLNKSEEFIHNVFQAGWEDYRDQNDLLIDTLNSRRANYLKRHLRTIKTFELDGYSFGVVYASDYKSEIAHELLLKNDVDAALVIDQHSVSLRSNGRLDVARFSEKYFRGGGHEDSAGGTLECNPIEKAEEAVIDEVLQQAQVNASVEAEEKNESSGGLGDQLDPEMAAKLAALFQS